MHDASLSYARYHRLSPGHQGDGVTTARTRLRKGRKAKTHPAVLRWNHMMKGCMEFQKPSNAMGTGTIPKSRTGLGGILRAAPFCKSLLAQTIQHVFYSTTLPYNGCKIMCPTVHTQQVIGFTQLSSIMRC